MVLVGVYEYILHNISTWGYLRDTLQLLAIPLLPKNAHKLTANYSVYTKQYKVKKTKDDHLHLQIF